MMAKLWHRASVPEDRVAMDSYVLHAPGDLPEQAAPAPAEEQLPGQPFKSVAETCYLSSMATDDDL